MSYESLRRKLLSKDFLDGLPFKRFQSRESSGVLIDRYFSKLFPLLQVETFAWLRAYPHTTLLPTVEICSNFYILLKRKNKKKLFFRLQLWYTKKQKPAIHLDNRYRLMRHEPMLDADGNETNEIGEEDRTDDTEYFPMKKGKDRE